MDEIYREFTRGLPSLLAAHADAIPGAAGTLRWSREHGIRTGSTTALIARSSLVARQEPLQQRRPASIRRTKYAG